MKENKCSILRRLCRCKSDDEFKKVLRNTKSKEMPEIVDMLVKVMSKKIPVSKRVAKSITQNRRHFRHLVHPKYSLQSKRRYILQQSGGSLKGIASALKSTLKVVGRSPIATRSLAATKALSQGVQNIPMATMTRGASSSVGSSVATKVKPPKRIIHHASRAHEIAKNRQAMQLAKSDVKRGVHYATIPLRKYGKWRGRNPLKTAAMDTTAASSAVVGAAAYVKSPNAPRVVTPQVFEKIPKYKLFKGKKGVTETTSPGGNQYEKATRGEVYKLQEWPAPPATRPVVNPRYATPSPIGSLTSLKADAPAVFSTPQVLNRSQTYTRLLPDKPTATPGTRNVSSTYDTIGSPYARAAELNQPTTSRGAEYIPMANLYSGPPRHITSAQLHAGHGMKMGSLDGSTGSSQQVFRKKSDRVPEFAHYVPQNQSLVVTPSMSSASSNLSLFGVPMTPKVSKAAAYNAHPRRALDEGSSSGSNIMFDKAAIRKRTNVGRPVIEGSTKKGVMEANTTIDEYKGLVETAGAEAQFRKSRFHPNKFYSKPLMNKDAINQKLKDIAKSGATKIALGGAAFGGGVAIGVLGSELHKEKNKKVTTPSTVATPLQVERPVLPIQQQQQLITERATPRKRVHYPAND